MRKFTFILAYEVGCLTGFFDYFAAKVGQKIHQPPMVQSLYSLQFDKSPKTCYYIVDGYSLSTGDIVWRREALGSYDAPLALKEGGFK